MAQFNIIQIEYDEVARSAVQFRQEAAATEDLVTHLRSLMAELQGGGWIGRGASAFYNEMEGDVLPALRRLTETLDYAGDTLEAISNLLSEAEEQAAFIIARS